VFARITRVASSPENIAQRAAVFERDLLPQIRDLPGFEGAAALGDRESGRGVSVTYWADAAAMRASEPAASAGWDQATQAGSTVLDIQRYELVVVERVAPPRANVFVRSNELDATTEKLDATIQFVRDKVLPNVRSQTGFRGMLMGVDRETGHCLVTSIWETAADRDASEAAVREQRREAGQVAGGVDPRVEHYEVLFAEMKQPARTG